MKSYKELLRDKRYGCSWTPDEVTRFIHAVVSGEVTNSQAAAFLMASCINGLTNEETSALTLSMAESGVTLHRRPSARRAIDKHSTGGVGDKISLLLAPLAVACGLDVPMISGRGLGHTGGTLDKLESVRGFSTNLSISDMEMLLENQHVFMAGQTPELVPADKILYALRDVTGTIEDISLITASILSKKIAEGLDGLVIDMKVGKGAFMSTLEDAQRLATSMRDVCTDIGLPVTFVFTRMDNPLGQAVGNWLEIAEAELSLATVAPRDIAEITIELVAQMLMLSNRSMTNQAARERVVSVWQNGEAHATFHNMIVSQGGRWHESVEFYGNLGPREVHAAYDGFIDNVDSKALALACLDAGAGRKNEHDSIDHGAGVLLTRSVGEAVQQGETIALAYASNQGKRDELARALNGILQTTTAPVVREPSMIIGVW